MKKVLPALLLVAASVHCGAADDLATLTEQVRATEIAFAKTLADRDVKAFRALIAPDVIWLADKPLRGPDQVLTRWQKFFDAPQPPFSWSPELVEVQVGGKLALSTGRCSTRQASAWAPIPRSGGVNPRVIGRSSSTAVARCAIARRRKSDRPIPKLTAGVRRRMRYC
jgi:ketosteroid isomerase-like protein